MQSKHAAIGIDLGSSRFVIASVMRGGVEILINEASYRSTPSLVSYGAERYLGDSAKGKIKSNIKNAVFYPTRYLGAKTDEDFAKERPFNYCSMRKNEQGKVEFNLMSEGEKKVFSSEQVLSSMFTQAKRVLDLNQITSSEIVASVPSFATYAERQAILDSAKVAGLNIVRLYNESTANIMNYGIFRKADLDAKNPRLVGFVDFGESKTSIFFANIYKDRAEIVLELNDRHLGARNLDANMADYYCKMFELKNNVDLRENPKSVYRLYEAIEKQRKVLSANSEATLHIECLFEDLDFSHTLDRAEFEAINKPVFARFEQLLKQATEQLGADIKNLHSIERIGGGMRIQRIEAAAEKAFNVQAISKTLDASESIARGCAIQAAMISPKYQVTPYEIKERNYYPINVDLCYQGEEQQRKVVTLFKRGHHLDSTLTISIKKPLPLTVGLREAGAAEREILFAEVEGMKPKHEGFEGKLWFNLNKNGIAELLRAEMIEKFKVTEKVPKSKKMEIEKDEKTMEVEQAEDFDVKEKEKTQTSLLNINVQYASALSQDEINQLTKEEEQMRKKEQILIDTHNSKYFLESFIYETRTLLNEPQNARYATDQERQAAIGRLADAESWLYSEGMNASKEVYDAKLAELHKAAGGFYGRYNKVKDAEAFYSDAFPAFSSFEASNGDMLAHGSALHLNEISTKMNESAAYLNDVKAMLDNYSIGATDAFDLTKIKTIINDNYKALNTTVQNIKKSKEEAERKKRDEERKAEEEKKAQAKKDGEEKKDGDSGMQEEPVVE